MSDRFSAGKYDSSKATGLDEIPTKEEAVKRYAAYRASQQGDQPQPLKETDRIGWCSGVED